LAALDTARITPPTRDVALLPYLADRQPAGFDLSIAVELNGEAISSAPFASMYWTAAQQLAHLTVNGASVRTGDLYASGTVSGPEPHQRGSLLELSWGGSQPVILSDGTSRTYLQDGDEVRLTATAPGPRGYRIGLGEVVGTVVAAKRD
jgi:fumarylacetoacetase